MTIASRLRQLLSATKGNLTLEGEGIESPIADPSDDVLRRELECLRGAGPSHLALLSPDGSYLQAAGTNTRMTVEAHLISTKGITHVVLGRKGPPGPLRAIASTTGPLSVHQSEMWAAPAAAQIFSRFAAIGTIPPELRQRDITATIGA